LFDGELLVLPWVQRDCEASVMFPPSLTRQTARGSRFNPITNWCVAVLLGISTLAPAISQTNSSTPDQQEIIVFLNQVIGWYQNSSSQQRITTTPSDFFFVNGNQSLADQIIQLSFEFAKARVELTTFDQSIGQGTAPPVDPQYLELSQSAAKLGAQANQMNSELAALQAKLPRLRPAQRRDVESRIAGLQSGLALLKERQSTLGAILQFMSGSSGTSGLSTQIDALERALPTSQAAQSPSAKSATPAAGASTSGPLEIWSSLQHLIAVRKKLQAIGASIHQTRQLSQNIEQLNASLTQQRTQVIRESESVANQQGSPDPAALAKEKNTLDALNNRFKRLSAVLIPLSKESILLDSCGQNLLDWQTDAKSEFRSTLKSLLFRLLILAVFLGIVLGAFAIWRRAIVRYVSDLRKRYQLLVLRRIALTIVITIFIAFALVTRFGSLATFAGLMTAGVAVALQNVILAIVGYFMMIGKFGVRAGDRVQVARVFGEVVEIGMLRLHLLELSGMEANAEPTGRVIAFSNSVVFQPTAGLFKDIPNTALVWREISFTLAPESDYDDVEERMLKAVHTAFNDYQGNLDRMRRQMESTLGMISISSLEPKLRFRKTASGIEVHIKFPSELHKAVEIDRRITQELLRAVEREPRLHVVEAEGPPIRRKTAIPSSESASILKPE
jgi:small-conductance mechanosensitive channel